MGFLFSKEDTMRTVFPGHRPEIRQIKKDPVKLTALIYLRDAILRERYEECREMITIAKEFGAEGFEIQNILEDPRRVPS